MSHAALSHPGHPWAASNLVAAAVLGVWLGIVLVLGARGTLVNAPGTAPSALLAAVLLPLVFFSAAFRFAQPFREFVLGIDLQLAASIQAWRMAGFGFLTLYAYDVLPGVFAFPAGLGDMAIGAAAPWIVLSLARDRSFAVRAAFRRWNLLGILDLVVAVSIGGLNSALATGMPGEITTGPMALLPLVLIPAYLVPIFIMLHFVALHRSRVLS